MPQGGNTGLVGGGVPLDGEVVLSLRRLDHLGPVDPLAAQVTAGAGATLAAVQAHVRPHGLAVGVDLAARDSATVGGMVATNAGGLQYVRHGPMRAQVAGLEAVLADGGVLSPPRRAGQGQHRLRPGRPPVRQRGDARRRHRRPAAPRAPWSRSGRPPWSPSPACAEAMSALASLRAAGLVLEAAELMLDDGLALVAAHLGATPPVSGPAVLLLEWAGRRRPPPSAEDLLARRGLDAAVADDPGRRAALWR